jgi:cytochrome c1
MKPIHLAMIAMLMALLGCDRDVERHAAAMTGGDVHKGKDAISFYGCTSCHTVPGIHGADSLVGPPLNSMAQRTYIGGVLPNTPRNMVQWLRDPPAVDPKTAMPNVHLSESDARDIASYLYTLR